MIDEWLARIDTHDRLDLTARSVVRYVARLADLYVVGREEPDPNGYPTREVWIAPVTEASREELRARLETLANDKPELFWQPNPAGTLDPFHAGYWISFPWQDLGERGDWAVARQPDGRFRVSTQRMIDDSGGGGEPRCTESYLDEAAAREAICEQLRHSRGNQYLMPTIDKP